MWAKYGKCGDLTPFTTYDDESTSWTWSNTDFDVDWWANNNTLSKITLTTFIFVNFQQTNKHQLNQKKHKVLLYKLEAQGSLIIDLILELLGDASKDKNWCQCYWFYCKET